MSTSSNRENAIVVTAADSGYFEMFQGMIHSLRRFESGRDLPIAVFDTGFEAEQRQWLEQAGVIIAQPKWYFGVVDGAAPHWHLAEVVRPYVRSYFPGYDHYMWLDPDLWLQDGAVIDRLIDGSKRDGAAIAHEADPAYKFQSWLVGWNLKHKILGLGLWHGLLLMIKPALNCGVYCFAADAPHWELWERRLQRAIDRRGEVAPYTQFTFNELVYVDRPPTTILDAADNWICDRAPPVWNDELQLYCKPYAPYQPVSILHLAGPAKRRCYDIQSISGDHRPAISLRYPHMAEAAG